MALHGIDIASWQAGMNAGKMDADFVIIKATGGTGYVNPSCDKHFQQAKKSGKLLGVYHYANEKGLEGTAKQEANFFVKNAKNYLKGDAIPILDWEASNKGNVKWALDWLNEVEKQTGIKPWFYTYTNVLNTYDFTSIFKNDNALWIAQYPDMNTHYGYIKNKKPPKTRKFPNGPAAYQYSSTTVIPGYGSPIDVDIFYGDKKAWEAYATPKGAKKVSKPTYQKEIGWYKVVKDDVFYKEKELKNKSGWKTKVGQTIYIQEVVNWGNTTRGKVMLAKHYRYITLNDQYLKKI